MKDDVHARGFAADKNDGRVVLPGSLHTNRLLSQWIDFSVTGVVRVYTGKVELGQGILTALALIAAEELDVGLERIQIIPAATVQGRPDEGMTSGSLSIQDSGSAIRQVCANVREIAQQIVSVTRDIPQDQLNVRDGAFVDELNNTFATYWNVITPEILEKEVSATVRFKRISDYSLIGKIRAARLDLADKVFGIARFIHDLRMDGMVHGRVVRPPSAQAAIQSIATDSVKKIEGVINVVVDGKFIGILAKTEATAVEAALVLSNSINWSEPQSLPVQAELASFLTSAPSEQKLTYERSADEIALDTRQIYSSQYFKPYLAHASIGPSCAIAQWNGEILVVWTHSQGIYNLREDIYVALSQADIVIQKENIQIHHVEGAGCYGHNGADDAAFDAVMLAISSPGAPVRVQWSRADELACGPLAPAQLVKLDASVDSNGNIIAWKHEVWSNGYSSRPGRSSTPTLLAAGHRACGTPPPIAINAPLSAGGGAERNAIPGYDIPNVKVLTNRLLVMPIRTSAIRALGAYANVFALESFIDEIAETLGEDRVSYRKRHLSDPRALKVIDCAIDAAEWWRAPKTSIEGGEVGYGFAWAKYKNTGAWCAVAARIEVNEAVRVTDIVLAVDVGRVIDLDGVINQIEGGALQSVSWTLKEQVTFDQTRITSNEWVAYPILRFSEVPKVEVVVVDRPEEESLGAGEAAQGPVAAALANALYDALGVRVRTLPLSQDNIVAAMDS
ncbi:MAG TPA: molybdopterin cofactor-binding domain-containing protein [Eoetvoesiella sp.]